MNSNPLGKFHGKGFVAGALTALAVAGLLGAGNSANSKVDALQQRFLILKSTPVRGAANGYQSHQLMVCPHYGKINQDSLKFRVEHETQEFTMIIVVSEGNSFKRGDIISFSAMHVLRLTPGSRITRHLPDGGQELVP
ncbi:hypothetical protein FYK55_00460 [Roseiconus nitratireducens]|uniref:Uncharacterized protein n=1 Tax=Roseiconus nitratireducens TaxID=2605748 RepID=A0A5M6DKZ6_9BACT|nr:hypothetical protein [Roseiconus nitratireducens]KAA5546932.1 hypothetical protein FYK55_00460 [Roseiconus nitratireducens]